jgi:hypothetical protein
MPRRGADRAEASGTEGYARIVKHVCRIAFGLRIPPAAAECGGLQPPITASDASRHQCRY